MCWFTPAEERTGLRSLKAYSRLSRCWAKIATSAAAWWAGLNSRREAAQRLAARARALGNVDWLDFSDDMGSEVAAADLVISMGGYNSVCEILSYRKRAIIIPRSVPVREQRMRAEAMQKLGLLRMVPIERIDPAGLARLISSELDLRNVVQSRAARISFNGLGEVCSAVLGTDLRQPGFGPFQSARQQ